MRLVKKNSLHSTRGLVSLTKSAGAPTHVQRKRIIRFVNAFGRQICKNSTFRIFYAKLYILLWMDGSTNLRNEIILGETLKVKYGSRSTRTKGSATNQTAQGSPSSDARIPDQPPIKPQANKISIYKRLLILAKSGGKRYRRVRRIKTDY